MNTKPALLALADGRIFEGIAVGAMGDAVGELVFNTGMTGYQEVLTDPSYAKQIVTLTASHIGNTGCNHEDNESSRPWAAGLVIKNIHRSASNYRATIDFPDWLKQKGIVAIAGIDTRALTIHLRDTGAQSACISTNTQNPKEAIKMARAFQGLEGRDLAVEVSRKTMERWDVGQETWAFQREPLKYHVVVYDFGVKSSILKILHDKGCHLTLVPARTTPEAVFNLNPDGILLSNGPGDPAACDYAIHATQTFLKKNVPLFGICLGFQILALALGAKTKKMKFGHHGANHPVLEMAAPNRVFITSQNHGFTLDESHLPKNMLITHRSLFDNTVQGLSVPNQKAFGFQGHPESSPGPHDIALLFQQFIEMMDKNRL